MHPDDDILNFRQVVHHVFKSGYGAKKQRTREALDENAPDEGVGHVFIGHQMRFMVFEAFHGTAHFK